MTTKHTLDLNELERLAQDVSGWSNCSQHWPLEDEEAPDGVHIVGAIDEGGERYDVMCIDADSCGTDGESAKLAAFYAAANPAAALELIERLKQAEQDVARHQMLYEIARRERELLGERAAQTEQALKRAGLAYTEGTAPERIDRLAAQNAERLAALQSIDKITDYAGWNIGGPMAIMGENITAEHHREFLDMACEYLQEISTIAGAAITQAEKGGA